MAANRAGEVVVMLHGLASARWVMGRLARRLRAAGYPVINWGYPSRSAGIELLAKQALDDALGEAREQGATRIHLLGHSLGCILIRWYLQEFEVPELGRVVMLGPPNRGTELVDRFGHWRLFRLVNGPAGSQLGTGEHSLPLQLGPVDYDLGVIAGNRSLYPLLSRFLPEDNDGNITVGSTTVEGMRDHIVLPVDHDSMTFRGSVIEQSLHFIQHGVFHHS